MEICYQPIIYAELVICIFNIIMKIIQSIFYRKLIKQSADMSKTRCKSIGNIKKQFDKEYSKMKKMNNINLFVHKSMYGIKMMGFKMAVWEMFGIINILICIILGTTAAIMSYINSYDEQYIIMHVLVGFVMGFLIILCDLLVNMQNKMEHLHINICEYLENKYIPLIENTETVFEKLPYESKDIDEGIKELFRLMNADNEEEKINTGLVDEQSVINDIEIDEKEEKILKDVFEEYLA